MSGMVSALPVESLAGDHARTRAVARAILKGAREAFLRRAKMYGISVPPADNR